MMQPSHSTRIASVFGVQLINSIVHHTTHPQALFGSISIIDLACTATLVGSLVYLGYQASEPPRPVLSGALWALLLWVFGVSASATVMRLVDAPRMDARAFALALVAAVVLAPVALALGALGAWRSSRLVVA
jgi:hypothetical protein